MGTMLETLRAKPKSWKRRFALAVSLGITLCFAALRVGFAFMGGPAAAPQGVAADVFAPFRQFGQAAGTFATGVSQSVGSAQQAISELSTAIAASATSTATSTGAAGAAFPKTPGTP